MNKNPTLLIVEDEPASLNMLTSYFEKDHYTVLKTQRGDEVEDILEENPVDIILLDIKLPGKDGFSVMRDIRAKGNVGVILVTSVKDDVDKIIGLEMGADDYVTKPYNLRELGARVKNLLARLQTPATVHSPSNSDKQISFQGWTLDKQKHSLKTPDNQMLKLTEGEYQVLSILISNAGSITNRDQIMKKMKQRAWCYSDRSIDVLIGRVRKKLEDDADSPSFIRTIHGAGYMFIGELD